MDEYKDQIEAGKQIITDYLQKERPDYANRINTFEWVPRSSDDIKHSKHRLVFYIEAKQYPIRFNEADLADAPGTSGWDRRLKEIIDQFFKGLLLT